MNESIERGTFKLGTSQSDILVGAIGLCTSHGSFRSDFIAQPGFTVIRATQNARFCFSSEMTRRSILIAMLAVPVDPIVELI